MFKMNGKVLFGAALALALVLGSARAPAQVIQGQALVQARQFADQALRNYVAATVKEDNAERLGFKTMGEAQGARLGEPIPVLLIGLSDLKAYRAGAAVGSILKDIRTLWFPVIVNGEVRSKLEIAEIKGKWVAGEFGRPATARAVSGVREGLSKSMLAMNVTEGATAVLVRIPVLHAQLFYESGPSGGFLVPALAGGLPEGVEVGKAYPADALLARFAEKVQAMDAKTVD